MYFTIRAASATSVLYVFSTYIEFYSLHDARRRCPVNVKFFRKKKKSPERSFEACPFRAYIKQGI